MNYTKPEVTVLGSASALIQECGKETCHHDGEQVSDSPAYDLDE